MYSADQLKNALRDSMTDQTLINQKRDSETAAGIRYDKEIRPRWASRITIALDTAMSFTSIDSGKIVGEPFDSFDVESATDGLVAVRMAFTSDDLYQTVNYKTLKQSDGMSFGRTVRKCLLEWDAQPGKTITFVFYLGAQFRAGSLRQILSGGVIQTTGAAMNPLSPVSVLVTATSLFAADTSRASMTIQNLGSNNVWISGVNTVTVGSGLFPGIKVEPGDTYTWTNTGAAYAIAEGATTLVGLNKEA